MGYDVITFSVFISFQIEFAKKTKLSKNETLEGIIGGQEVIGKDEGVPNGT